MLKSTWDAWIAFRQLEKRRLAFSIGWKLALMFVMIAFISYAWTPYSVDILDIPNRFQSPSSAHWLGTDHYGRDIVSMLMLGTQNSISVALIALGVGVFTGVPLGLWAAARGGWIDQIIMRVADFTFAFPALLSAFMITAIFRPGAEISMIAIGIFNIPVFARVARGSALSIWQLDYIRAAQLSGKGWARISLQHVLPNIQGVLIVQATIQFALAILAEAGLSYLGLGTQPPDVSWGRMLYDAQSQVWTNPMQAVYPGLTITFCVLALNLFGDGLRDVLDVKLDGKR